MILEMIGYGFVNVVGIIVLLALFPLPNVYYDDDDFLIITGPPSVENPLAGKTLAERQYWLGRGSSPDDPYWEYVLARGLSFEAWKREVNYIRTPENERPERTHIPIATVRILERIENGEKLSNLRKEW